MNTRRFLLGSGFHRYSPAADWFLRLWLKNVEGIGADRIFVVSVGDALEIVDDEATLDVMLDSNVRYINLSGNLLHVHNLLGKAEPKADHDYCGWSAAVLSTAMLAYTNNSDFLWQEQDCLAFGPWIEKLYKELGQHQMIFGKNKLMGCAQSLFLIKHDFIPTFIRSYLEIGSDKLTLPESKFCEIQKRWSGFVKQFSFGYDRERPINLLDDVWYAQKFSREELLGLRAAGLIQFDNIPDGLFTSTI